jgi:hypothetical protein
MKVQCNAAFHQARWDKHTIPDHFDRKGSRLRTVCQNVVLEKVGNLEMEGQTEQRVEEPVVRPQHLGMLMEQTRWAKFTAWLGLRQYCIVITFRTSDLWKN